jgi:hypothetical protein
MESLLADPNADSAIRVGDEPFELGCVDRSGVDVEAARASAEGLDWRMRVKSIDRAEVYEADAAGGRATWSSPARPRRPRRPNCRELSLRQFYERYFILRSADWD